MVNVTTVPSESLPPSPLIWTTLLGAIATLLLSADGSLLGVGCASKMAVVTVALDSEPLLLLGSGSKVVDRLWEVLLMVPVAGTTTVTSRLVLLPLAKLGIVGKVTTPVTGS
ncbi:hypothetical protein E5S67_05425 [Microcoleus sp. IPMA8]|uniref:Uncharacterized protein n=1 Tax=Microcoleus asticus IPMA8 TaxID=2563858 RepID=A0ABX2D6W8_9CYAN|nr:hypothetical protein [Microcoleus asticus IPMA8]